MTRTVRHYSAFTLLWDLVPTVVVLVLFVLFPLLGLRAGVQSGWRDQAVCAGLAMSMPAVDPTDDDPDSLPGAGILSTPTNAPDPLFLRASLAFVPVEAEYPARSHEAVDLAPKQGPPSVSLFI